MKFSKSLIAFMLVCCMLLSTVPVFGAQLQATVTEFYVPEEGLEIACTAAGTDGSNLKFVLSADSVKALGITHSYTKESLFNAEGSVYEGLVLSGTVAVPDSKVTDSMKEATAAGTPAVTGFTFTNVPVKRVSYRNNNGLSFGIDKNNLLNRSYVTNVTVWDATTETSVPYDGTLTKANYQNSSTSFWYDAVYCHMTAFRVDRGTWTDVKTYDTGVFPANTIFINAFNLEKTALDTATVDEGYNDITARRNARGDFGIFIPQVSGDYYVYALRHHHSSGDGDRTSKITISTSGIVNNVPTDVSTNFVFSGSVGATSATGHSFFWCAPAGDVGTVALKKGEPFLLRRNKGGNYDRLAGIALVPADKDGNNPMLSVEDATWTYTNLPADDEEWNIWEKLTVAKEDVSGSVTVTVNGVETVVPALAARKTGYDAEEGTLAWGKKTDRKGDIITYPTVFDALVTATSPEEGNENGYVPYDPVADGMSANSCPAGYAIEVNGKACLYPAMTEIKAGDVINTVANNPGNFKPAAMALPGDNASGLASYFGIADITQNKLQFGLRLEPAYKIGYTADEEGNNAADFTGCSLSGYLRPRYSEPRWGTIAPDSASAFYTDSKIYFDAKVMYRGTNNSEGQPYFYIAENERNEVTIAPSREEGVITVNDTLLHHPYKFSDSGNTSWDYLGANLYLINKNADTGVQVHKSVYSDRVSLTTEATKQIALFVITYAEDGKTITNKQIIDNIYLTWEKPYALNVADNQKVFVWGQKTYEGTTMIPLVQPITK